MISLIILCDLVEKKYDIIIKRLVQMCKKYLVKDGVYYYILAAFLISIRFDYTIIIIINVHIHLTRINLSKQLLFFVAKMCFYLPFFK